MLKYVWPLLVAAICFALAFCNMPAKAQDRGQWFKSLRQPDSGASCCDISDCKRTSAEWRKTPGGWWAASPYHKTMVPVPDEKVIRNIPSIDGEAYLCEGMAGTLYCFVPPSPGT